MRFYRSLPKNAPFFQYYAGLIPTLFKVGYLSQMFSAAIELYILTSILRPKFAPLTDHATAAAVFCASLLVALLEGGLRTGAAYSVRAILYKKFTGLHLVMSVAVWVLFLSLLVCSLTLHIEGAKEAVQANADAPTIEATTHTEATQAADIAAAVREFTQDSAAIYAAAAAQIAAIKAQTKAQVRAETARPGGTYAGAMAIQADGAAKVAALEQDRAAKVADALERKNRATDAARQRRDLAQSKIEGRNDNERAKNEAKTAKYSGYLSTFSVLVVLFFLLTIGLNEVNNKGSEVEHIAVLNQYQFEPGLLAKAWAAVGEKFQYHARNLIERLEQRTPQPAQPLEPHPLFDWGAFQQGRATLKTRPRIAPELIQDAAKYASRAANKEATGETAAKVMPADSARARDNAMSYEQEPAKTTVEVDTALMPCRRCDTLFKPRTTWQVYCSEVCKLADHQAKHGGTKFDPTKAKFKRVTT